MERTAAMLGVSMSMMLLASMAPAAAVPAASAPAATGPAKPSPIEPIERVRILPNRAFEVNGRAFFPLMAWLQDAGNFPAVRACGMNATAGYWPESSGTRDVREYVDLVEKGGLYGVMPFDPHLKGHPALLGYIQDDEPDLPQQVSDAKVEPAPQLRINRSTPLWKLLDGDLTSWSVLDPLQGAEVTVVAGKPITAEALGVALTISPGLAVAKDVAFEADGRETLKAALEPKKGRQKLSLPAPATFSRLKLKVISITPGKEEWGSVGEIEAFDKDGKNVLLSPPRMVPRAMPDETMRKYQAMKAADASRPVFMTLTGYFHPIFKKWTDSQQAMYTQYVRAADVVGYDIYPIYGWNKPDWLHLVHEGTDILAKLAGEKPIYAWIETSKGGQWTGALENQKDVTPAHIRAEVWMAICRGATAIGYFTHIWKPSYSQFGVPEANRQALRQINDQITHLAPAILGDPPKCAVAIEAPGDVKLDVLARSTGGELWLFAVNYDQRLKEAAATIKVDGLPAGTEIAVVDEGRAIRSAEGSFADAFEPLAVHIYRCRLPR